MLQLVKVLLWGIKNVPFNKLNSFVEFTFACYNDKCYGMLMVDSFIEAANALKKEGEFGLYQTLDNQNHSGYSYFLMQKCFKDFLNYEVFN